MHLRGPAWTTLITFIVALAAPLAAAPAKTRVAIEGDRFLINGEPTFKGRSWRGVSLEGLLPNARLVQATFDDLNPETRGRWVYPDTGTWDPGRNTREFLAAMPEWRRHGLLAFTINLQGGSPYGYSKGQPWENSALAADGSLRPDYMQRTAAILDRADELGMVVILGIYYFGQDERIRDEEAVKAGVRNVVTWVLDRGYRHVLIEINNECTQSYDHPILKPDRVHELITLAQGITRDGERLLCSVSYRGNFIPSETVAGVADFLLLHGNGVSDPARITAMVEETRRLGGGRPKPIVFNEDDHFDFDRPMNNFVAATLARASWGYYHYRMKGEGFDEGFQSVPVNWSISSARKRGFFGLLAEITQSDAPTAK